MTENTTKIPFIIGAPGVGDNKDLITELAKKLGYPCATVGGIEADIVDTNQLMREARETPWNEVEKSLTRIENSDFKYEDAEFNLADIMALFLREMSKALGKENGAYREIEDKIKTNNKLVWADLTAITEPVEPKDKDADLSGDPIDKYSWCRVFETITIDHAQKTGVLEGKILKPSGSFGLYPANKDILPADKYDLVLVKADLSNMKDTIFTDAIKNLTCPLGNALDVVTKGCDRRERYETCIRNILVANKIMASKDLALTPKEVQDIENNKELYKELKNKVCQLVDNDAKRPSIFQESMGSRIKHTVDIENKEDMRHVAGRIVDLVHLADKEKHDAPSPKTSMIKVQATSSKDKEYDDEVYDTMSPRMSEIQSEGLQVKTKSCCCII